MSGSDLGSLSYPVSTFVDNNNTLYIADRDNNRIMQYLANATIGVIVAGNGTVGNASNQLNGPKGVAVDQYGAIIVADSNNYRIQKFPAGYTNGTTLAYNSSVTPLGQMRDIHIDVNDNIYVTDSDNNQVVKFTASSTINIIVAGGGAPGSAANQLNGPYGSCKDENGTLYVADSSNERVLKYVSGSLNGILVAGENSTAGSNLTSLNNPLSVIVDNNGYNNWVWVILQCSMFFQKFIN
jgi:tripartite motif-containing protein 71